MRPPADAIGTLSLIVGAIALLIFIGVESARVRDLALSRLAQRRERTRDLREFLFLVPLLWPDGERHWSRRPAAIAAVALPFIAYASLTVAGIESPWVPKLEGGTLPASVTQGLGDSARRGADLFVTKACFACHAIESAGGRRGPDLSHVASRMGHDQITARIATGGGGMPAFAGSLAPSELDDLVTFLLTRK